MQTKRLVDGYMVIMLSPTFAPKEIYPRIPTSYSWVRNSVEYVYTRTYQINCPRKANAGQDRAPCFPQVVCLCGFEFIMNREHVLRTSEGKNKDGEDRYKMMSVDMDQVDWTRGW